MHPRPISILIISAFTSQVLTFSMGRRSKSHSNPTTSMARKKTKALKEDEDDYISHLPHNIVTDILRRLPFKTLFNCRFVCKTWLHLLKDPSFTQLCHTRVNSNWTILLPKVKDHHLYAVHLYNSSSVIHSSARVRFATKTHWFWVLCETSSCGFVQWVDLNRRGALL